MVLRSATMLAARAARLQHASPLTTAVALSMRATAAPRTALLMQRRFAQTSSGSTNASSQAAKAAATTAAPDASSAAAAANTNASADSSTGANGSEQEPPKYKPGWFSRNPGITLGGIVLAIALYFYRGSRNKKNFDALQLPLAEAAVISPYEAWELRSANDITPETFEAVRASAMATFPSHKASMRHFDQFLGVQLLDACPNGLRNVHHLERVLLSLERSSSDSDNPTKPTKQQLIDVDALLVAFSMAVKGAVDDRLQCLFDVATESTAPTAAAAADGIDSEEEYVDDNREITQQQLERLLSLLLLTYQIPSEKRVLPIDDEYLPFQQYKIATPSELLTTELQAQVKAKTRSADDATNCTSFTFDAFSQIMRGKTVCLWGECFANAKKRMKN